MRIYTNSFALLLTVFLFLLAVIKADSYNVTIDDSLNNVTLAVTVTPGSPPQIELEISYPAWNEEPSYHPRVWLGANHNGILNEIYQTVQYDSNGSCDPIKSSLLQATPQSGQWVSDITDLLTYFDTNIAYRNGWAYNLIGPSHVLSKTFTLPEYLACTSACSSGTFTINVVGNTTIYQQLILFAFVKNESAINEVDASGKVAMVDMHAWKDMYLTIYITNDGQISATITPSIAKVTSRLVGAVWFANTGDLLLTYEYLINSQGYGSASRLYDWSMDPLNTGSRSVNFTPYQTNNASLLITTPLNPGNVANPASYSCVTTVDPNICEQFIVYRAVNVTFAELPTFATYLANFVHQQSTGFIQNGIVGSFVYNYYGKAPRIEEISVNATRSLSMKCFTDAGFNTEWVAGTVWRQWGSVVHCVVQTPVALALVGTPNEPVLDVTRLDHCEYDSGPNTYVNPGASVNCIGAASQQQKLEIFAPPTVGNTWMEVACPISTEVTGISSSVCLDTGVSKVNNIAWTTDTMYIQLMAFITITDPLAPSPAIHQRVMLTHIQEHCSGNCHCDSNLFLGCDETYSLYLCEDANNTLSCCGIDSQHAFSSVTTLGVVGLTLILILVVGCIFCQPFMNQHHDLYVVSPHSVPEVPPSAPPAPPTITSSKSFIKGSPEEMQPFLGRKKIK